MSSMRAVFCCAHIFRVFSHCLLCIKGNLPGCTDLCRWLESDSTALSPFQHRKSIIHLHLLVHGHLYLYVMVT